MLPKCCIHSWRLRSCSPPQNDFSILHMFKQYFFILKQWINRNQSIFDIIQTQQQFQALLNIIESNHIAYMQSKYRKLYLYASNTQAITKRSNQTQDQYTLNKEKSIQQLKQLLDIKIGLPSLHSINGEEVPINNQNITKIDKYIVKKPKLKQKINIKPKSQFSLPLPDKHANFQIQKLSQYNYSKQNKARSIAEQRERKYEKYINQYMQKIEKEQILQKIPEEDYKILIQEACREIRRRIIEDECQIQQVQKGLEQSIDQQLLKNRKQGIKDRSSKKKQKKKIFKNEELSMQSQAQRTSDRLFLRLNHHKKSKSLADNNIYKLNLQMMQKITQLKNKQRRRSQKQFVRNLGKFSLFFNKQTPVD